MLKLRLATALVAALATSPATVAAEPAPADITSAPRVGAERRSAMTIDLYPGVAPGSEGWTRTERVQPHIVPGARMIRNVVKPTLEVFLPDPDKATGAGVIVAPGGGMRFVSYDTEGVWVAQWLAAHGVAAFVLKYRTVEMPADDDAFMAAVRTTFAAARANPAQTLPPEGAAIATKDGVRALQLARERAHEWQIDPDRIGMIGFSAGARVTVGVVSADAKPAFAAAIYGGAFGEEMKIGHPPPMFLAVSADDILAAGTVLDLFSKLRESGNAPELHFYHTGGHGYGLEQRDNSSAHWIEEFYWWLRSGGFLKTGH